MQNLMIVSEMSSPVSVLYNYINLDGLLATAYGLSNNLQDEKIDLSKPINIDIPLKKINDFYACSTSFFVSENNLNSSEKWYKRWEESYTDYIKVSKKINTGRGAFKNYAVSLPTLQTKYIVWFAVGEKEQIIKMLENNIFDIGKKRSQGYGKIKKWFIKEIAEDYSLNVSGKPTRQIPVECISFETSKQKKVTYKFPYFAREFSKICHIPEKNMLDFEEFKNMFSIDLKEVLS
jgi:hypothetical protein